MVWNNGIVLFHQGDTPDNSGWNIFIPSWYYSNSNCLDLYFLLSTSEEKIASVYYNNNNQYFFFLSGAEEPTNDGSTGGYII